MATGVHSSKCGDRQSAYEHIRRDATAGPSGHWLKVAAKATPPTHTREGLALGGDTRPALSGFLLGSPRECTESVNGILDSSSAFPKELPEPGIEPRTLLQLANRLTTALQRLP